MQRHRHRQENPTTCAQPAQTLPTARAPQLQAQIPQSPAASRQLQAPPQWGAGSSNDHLREMSFPFTNHQQETPLWPMASFPTYDPTSGWRPNLAASCQDVFAGTDTRATQVCELCRPGEGTKLCPAYRALANQGHDHKKTTHVRNLCANIKCKTKLCTLHLMRNDRNANDQRLKCCPECSTCRAHCTACGQPGVDTHSHTYKETNGKTYWRRDTTLWPCRPSIGCYNYLCRRCGAAMDGCQIHHRKDSCDVWRDTWGDRCWNGQIGLWATTIRFTAAQAALAETFLQGQQQQLQAQIAITDGGAASPDTPQPTATAPAANNVDPAGVATIPQGSRAAGAIARLMQQQQQAVIADDHVRLRQAIYNTLYVHSCYRHRTLR